MIWAANSDQLKKKIYDQEITRIVTELLTIIYTIFILFPNKEDDVTFNGINSIFTLLRVCLLIDAHWSYNAPKNS